MNLPLIRLNSKCVEFFTIIAIWTGGYLLYGTSFPFDYDSVNYALGIIEKFNVSENTPHPPGYFFHILLGKFLHLFLENPFQIQQIENILYLLLLLSVLFMIPTCNGIRVFICTLPLFLFLVGAPVHYAALAGFSGLISYLVFFTIEKKISPILLIVAFSIAIGFRQDLSLFLLPSILYAIWVRKVSKKEIVMILLLLIGISLIWFIPTYITTQEEGGPILLTMNFFLIFSKESSFFLGAPLKEAIRCGLRFILFSIAVLGPGGVVYLFLSLKKVSRYSLKLLLLGTFPSLLFGIFFHGPKPGYLATALGFFLVWSLKFALPSLKIVIIMFLFFINILFFVSIPSYSNWWSLQKERVTSQSKRDYSQKAKNLLYVSIGSSGMKELLYYRALHRKADSLYKSCNCVYDKILDHRVLYYFTSYVWHNQLNSSANSECCRNRIKLDKY